MGEASLSKEELNSLLQDAIITSDDTGKYNVKNNIQENQLTQKKDSNKIVQDNYNKDLLSVVNLNNMTEEQHKNAELLLDVLVTVTVELGRTNINVKEVLSLGEGSIIELGKPANEPVDLLINNRLLARGEVVVIDENFGTRLTNIVNPSDHIT